MEVLRTFPSPSQFDQACALGWDEAAAICRKFLKITPPTLPLQPEEAAQELGLNGQAIPTDIDDSELVSGNQKPAAEESNPFDGTQSESDLSSLPVDQDPLESAETAETDDLSELSDIGKNVLQASRATAQLHVLDQELEEVREAVATAEANGDLRTQARPLLPKPAVRPDIPNLLTIPSKILSPDSLTPIVARMVESRYATQSSSGVRSELIDPLKNKMKLRLDALEGECALRNAIVKDLVIDSLIADTLLCLHSRGIPTCKCVRRSRKGHDDRCQRGFPNSIQPERCTGHSLPTCASASGRPTLAKERSRDLLDREVYQYRYL